MQINTLTLSSMIYYFIMNLSQDIQQILPLPER